MDTRHLTFALAGALLCAGAGTARATDGHLLHGVGAINSAMGGVGVASSTSILGAFYVNPAGLANFSETRMEMGFEMMRPARTLSSSAGPASGSTTSSSEFTPIPAFAWSRPTGDGDFVVGVAGIGAAGFGVDYPLDPTNPLLAPRPSGFGQMFSSFQMMKIAPAIAFRASPVLRLGFALNVDWSSLAVDPMPTAAPAVDPGPDGVPFTADDRAYYSRATDADGAFGVGFQAGLQYDLTDEVAIGLAYTSPQWFQEYEYDAVYENPNLPSFNTPRTIRFRMDIPAIFGAGVSFQPVDGVVWQADAKYITYAETRGFDESGFAPDGSVRGFGWQNIWSFATGVELAASRSVTLRFGYNYSDNPIPDELSMFNTPAPAVVQHHATAGFGFQFTKGFGMDIGYYHAFENSIAGPMLTPAGPMPGTRVESRMSENSILLGFRYAPSLPQ